MFSFWHLMKARAAPSAKHSTECMRESVNNRELPAQNVSSAKAGTGLVYTEPH